MLGDYETRLTRPVTPQGFEGVWPTGPRCARRGARAGLDLRGASLARAQAGSAAPALHATLSAPTCARARARRRAGALGAQVGLFRAPAAMQQKIDMVATRGAESMVVV